MKQSQRVNPESLDSQVRIERSSIPVPGTPAFVPAAGSGPSDLEPANFHSIYLPRLGFRAKGFETIFELLSERWREVGPLTLVETGCVRAEGNWAGDGNSSVMFDAFASATASKFITIDISPQHCDLARRLCSHATVVCGDSVAALYRLRQSISNIDFLYLDSMDIDWNNPHPSALHHLKELCAAAPLLKPGSLVFVDDNQAQIGKGMYVRAFMADIGATVVHDEYQIGFIMP
jgi:hypothetical protein